MDRLDEIWERCDAATPGPWWWSLSDLRVVVWGGAQDGNAATGKQIVVDGDEDFDCCPENAEFITNAREDIPYLLEQINISTARAEKAAAERDTYRAALQLLELMISGEREGSKEREHSVGVVIAVNRARELMKGE